jgi:hypothetical protein
VSFLHAACVASKLADVNFTIVAVKQNLSQYIVSGGFQPILYVFVTAFSDLPLTHQGPLRSQAAHDDNGTTLACAVDDVDEDWFRMSLFVHFVPPINPLPFVRAGLS